MKIYSQGQRPGLVRSVRSQPGMLYALSQADAAADSRLPHQPAPGPANFGGIGPNDAPGGGGSSSRGGQDPGPSPIPDDEHAPDPINAGARAPRTPAAGENPMIAPLQNGSADPTPQDLNDFLGGPNQCSGI